MQDVLPFPDYSSNFWRALDGRFLAAEHVVSKIHALEMLEELSPYRGSIDPIFRRIWRSLDYLQRFSDMRPEWLNAALLVFANVVYLPQTLLEDAWRGLFIDLAEHELDLSRHQAILDGTRRIHIFENDPSGMTAAFCHLNGIQGRLDNERFARVEGTDKLADTLLDLLNPQKRNDAQRTLRRLLLEKEVWILLVDKSLSGHSLCSDIERLLAARRLAISAGATPPRIVVLCQVMTRQAWTALDRTVVEQLEQEKTDDVIAVHSAVFLDDRQSIASPSTTLVDHAHQGAIRELCEWFAQRFLKNHADLARMRKRSGDDLRFGYRACGLTLVDYQNCPTDSLPLLWFGSDSSADAEYVGPYVRVHSRIGRQSYEPAADKWNTIVSSGEIVQGLASVVGDVPR